MKICSCSSFGFYVLPSMASVENYPIYKIVRIFIKRLDIYIFRMGPLLSFEGKNIVSGIVGNFRKTDLEDYIIHRHFLSVGSHADSEKPNDLFGPNKFRPLKCC